ncbi:ATP-grasp domain-containing protein [Fimbriiglobus ruber]|uniref:Putative glutaminyl transferase n=1 Tax=Fimbriiglobus ruber TaxID=1908690 RepID=A0A225D2G5_9BACT|nr:RimK family alpha-L-glutamate ligase [Fimbriiglobus ruber]OWK35781.1 putative glutaminyl transferase [Fimbriiglobus ruber]
MRVAILSGGTGWHVQDLARAAADLGHHADVLDFRRLSAAAPGVTGTTDALAGYDGAIVRTMPAGSLEQIVFRMDLLHAAAANGVRVLNPPRAVEACVDKYLANVRFVRAGLPVPVTVACQRADDALAAFDALGGDVVVKPLFGAEGRGMVRVSDPELAWRTFRAIEQTGGVLYLQQFIRHPGWDARAFVIGGRVVAAMRRTSRDDWRTNVAQGGAAERMELAVPERDLAVRAARAVGAAVAGVDLLPGPRGEWYVIEVNAVPGWRALSAACDLDVATAVVRFLAEEYQA